MVNDEDGNCDAVGGPFKTNYGKKEKHDFLILFYRFFWCVGGLGVGVVADVFLILFFVCYFCSLMMFCDWRECVMSVPGTTNHS